MHDIALIFHDFPGPVATLGLISGYAHVFALDSVVIDRE